MAAAGSLKMKIYTSIFESIVRGEYGVNDILSEKKLVEKYEVSKSPVREALVELCNEGILKSMPRYGYAVVQLTKKDVENILDFRVVVELDAVKRSIKSITEKQIDELEEIHALDCGHESQPDFWQRWNYNKQFHLKLFSYCGNKFVYNVLSKALDTLTRAYGQLYSDSWNDISFSTDKEHHAEIIKALREKDVEKVIQLLKTDILDFEM